MVAITETAGLIAGYTDISLWNVIKGGKSAKLDFDAGEYNGVTWFSFAETPVHQSDPHLGRLLTKLSATEA